MAESDRRQTPQLDKVCLVTGAGRGLGAATARAFAAAGARVVVADLFAEPAQAVAEAIVAEGGAAIGVATDVTSGAAVDSLVAGVLSEYGALEVLVHCAGIARLPAQKGTDGWLPMQDLAEEVWDRIIDVNLKGTFLVNQRIGAHMVEQRSGSIVNVGSISGVVANKRMRGHGAYCASKAGVISLTRVLATEWAEFGVRVNAISPAYMNTEMMAASRNIPGVYEMHIDMIPMARYGEPKEFARAALFLASDAASYVTGHNLMLDGGYTAW